MKIEWLNGDRSEAIITRGFFRKRCAHVKRSSEQADKGCIAWWYAGSDTWVHNDLDDDLEVARRGAERAERAAKREAEQLRHWVKPAKLPTARVVK